MPDLLTAPAARTVWRDLAGGGALDRLYPAAGGRGPVRPDPGELAGLLASVDAEHPIGVTLSVCVQAAVVVPALLSHDGLAREVGRAALRGEAVTALAATDRDAPGSDLTSLGTTATLDGDTVEVDGGKRWIVNATTADHFLVLARHRPGRHFTSFALVLVPAGAVHAEPASTEFFAGSGVGHLRFDRLRLGRGHLVGHPGRGLAEFANRMVDERLAGGLWAGALCRRVLARTHARLREHRVGGQPLWHNEAVRQRFARCLLEQRRLAALTAWAAGGGAAEAMVLKAAVPDAVDAVLGGCARLGGADEFADGGLYRLRAEAAMFGVAGGTTDTMLAGIADHADRLLGSVR